MVLANNELYIDKVEIELLIGEDIAEGHVVDGETAEEDDEQIEYPEGNVLFQFAYELVACDNLVQSAYRVLLPIHHSQSCNVQLFKAKFNILDIFLCNVVYALDLLYGHEETLDIGQFLLSRPALASSQQACLAHLPPACPLYFLQFAEMLILIHPTSLEEIVLVVMALQFRHFLEVILKDSYKGTNSYLLQSLQFLYYYLLMIDLHSDCPEQIAHVLVIECALLDSYQIDSQIFLLQLFYPCEKSITFFCLHVDEFAVFPYVFGF